MATGGRTLWGRFNKSNRKFRDRSAIIFTGMIEFLRASALGLWLNELSRKSYGRIAIITGVIAFASAPALALGVYVFLGTGTTSNGSRHEATTLVPVTWAVQTNWAIQRENKGDRIVPSAADTVRQRFIFDAIADNSAPEKVPLPRPRPEELIALDAPPIDLQPALDRNKRDDCEWNKLRRMPDVKLEALPDFMRSCVGPPIQLTPPRR